VLPGAAVVFEETSTSTRTNAVNSLQLAAARGWESVVVITNPFHQFRSYRTFRCAAREVPQSQQPRIWLARAGAAAPMPVASRALYELRLQWDIYREVLAIAWYWWCGWLC